LPDETSPAADAPDAPDDLLAHLRRDPVRGLAPVLASFEASLLRHAAAVVGSAAAAQDVVQESFLRLLANGQPIENLSAWLHRVTHNLAVDHLRKESRLRKLHLAAAPRTEPVAPSPADDMDKREAHALLQDELERLSANERAVLALKIKEGRSYQEISEMTGLSVSNVGYLIHQGLKKLTARLRAASRKEVAS
jgi:RNA polymerase sigma-70 factor (ECF subfamily)